MNSYEIQRSHDDFLDELYEPFKIGELSYSASDVLKSVDPVTYQISLSEYEDMLCEDDDDDAS